jgi:uncharacterized membrane protein (UPF0127 family)
MKIRYLLAAVPLILALFFFFYFKSQQNLKNLLFSGNSQNITRENSKSSIIVSGKTIFVDIADTPSLQTKGLSGRKSLNEDEGMFFIFPDSQIRYFWMKDMQFPIDILWIDNEGKICGIEKDTPIPEANTPDYKLPVYSSFKPAKYVLEVNAGFSQKYSVTVGDQLDLSKI